MARKRGNKTRRRKHATLLGRTRRRVGAPPGSLPPAGAPPARLTALRFDSQACQEQRIEHPDQLGALLAEPGLLWIDAIGADDPATLQHLGELLNLHPLALEDAASGHQRPKIEEYPDLIFMVLRMPAANDMLSFEQLSMFIGKNFVLTIQERVGDCLEPLRERIRRGLGRVRQMGVDYLAYAIIDAVVDSFFPLLESYADRLDELEAQALASPAAGMAIDIHGVRHDLRATRRVLWSTREALNDLLRNKYAAFGNETRVFLRDCEDHTAQLLDIVESSQGFATSLMDLHLASQNERMNEIMKMLTLIATLFMPLSFIAGIYGMNFDGSEYNMPELHWRYGYLFSLALMAVTAGGLLWFFRRRGWLGHPAPRWVAPRLHNDGEGEGRPRPG